MLPMHMFSHLLATDLSMGEAITTKSNLRDKKICLPIPIANMLKINNKECSENRYAGQISNPIMQSV